MEFTVLNTNLMPVGIVEVYRSAIWTERYCSIGDFEIQIPLDSSIVSHIRQNSYLTLKGTSRAMIIETLNTTSDEDTGNRVLTVKGSSLESILERRIVWKTTVLNGNPLTELRRLLDENIMNPPANESARRIPNFVFPLPQSGDPVHDFFEGKTLSCQFTGDNLYDVVVSFCKAYDLDFKITLTVDKKFKFELVMPVDHSISQTEHDIVIFSPENDTLIRSEWFDSNSSYRNVALVLGQGTGSERSRRTVFSENNEPSGLERRELYVDARDLSATVYDGEESYELSESEYNDILDYRGYEKLAENSKVSLFDGRVETSIGPQYGQNYEIGDYVTVINEFGRGSTAVVSEYIRSFGSEGYSAYPTFIMVG